MKRGRYRLCVHHRALTAACRRATAPRCHADPGALLDEEELFDEGKLSQLVDAISSLPASEQRKVSHKGDTNPVLKIMTDANAKPTLKRKRAKFNGKVEKAARAPKDSGDATHERSGFGGLHGAAAAGGYASASACSGGGDGDSMGAAAVAAAVAASLGAVWGGGGGAAALLPPPGMGLMQSMPPGMQQQLALAPQHMGMWPWSYSHDMAAAAAATGCLTSRRPC
jgi:hypothetical protein